VLSDLEIVTSSIDLPVRDGTSLPAYVARPSSRAGGPGILVLQDQFGLTRFLRDVAERFARLGFTAIAPALYHRSGRIEIPYDDGYEASKPHHRAVTVEGQLADVEAAYGWLTAAGNVAPDRIPAIGFCMGGRLAYVANAHLPLRAAISFYGGKIAPDLLHLASMQRGPLLCFWGGRDTVIPKEQYRAVADGLTDAGADHDQVVFSDAKHAFFAHTRSGYYHERAAREAWAMSLALLDAQGLVLAPAAEAVTAPP
jgi:carboxymethylenebutenolidase